MNKLREIGFIYGGYIEDIKIPQEFEYKNVYDNINSEFNLHLLNDFTHYNFAAMCYELTKNDSFEIKIGLSLREGSDNLFKFI